MICRRPVFMLLAGIMLASATKSAAQGFEASGGSSTFTWSGPYAGTFAGYGAGSSSVTPICGNQVSPVSPVASGSVASPSVAPRLAPDDPSKGPAPIIGVPIAQGASAAGCSGGAAINVRRPAGFVAGVQVGYNYQPVPGQGPVFGIEGDYQMTRLRAFTESNVENETLHVGSAIDRLGTARLRFGYAFGKLLVFGTGGLAIGDVRLDANVTQNSNLNGAVAYSAVASQAAVRLGYALGGGLEYAFTENVSAKFEGQYFDLGERTIGAPELRRQAGLPTTSLTRYATIATNGFLVRAGLNYHYGRQASLHSALEGITKLWSASDEAATDWVFESGLRYVYTSGLFRYDLGAPGNAVQLNSRLTYKGIDAHAAEAFTRIDHVRTGLYLKGFLGAGATRSGLLRDEDFPPAITPYSNTVSHIQNGDIAYATLDAGYDILRAADYKIGGFLGYNYVSESVNAYGCSQAATNRNICTPAIQPSVKVLSEDAQWHSLRIGVAGEARYDRIKLTADAAYLPVVGLSGYDHHWLRPDINALSQLGHGDGYQIEAAVSYAVIRAVSVGFGARYWTMRAQGAIQFPRAVASPSTFQTERITGFIQASYKFAE